MKVYISGQITELDLEQAKYKFNWAESWLKVRGYIPVNPMNVSPYVEGKEWKEYMKECVAALFDCDAIYMLSNWRESKGARIEKAIAEEMKMTIMFE
jgi:hypothetical protein